MEAVINTPHMAKGALAAVALFMLFLFEISLIFVFYVRNSPNVGYAVVDLLLLTILADNCRLKTIVLKCLKVTSPLDCLFPKMCEL